MESSTQIDLKNVIVTVKEILKAEKLDLLLKVLSNSEARMVQTGYDNWNGGMYSFTVYLTVSVELFVEINDCVDDIEKGLLAKFGTVTRHIDDEDIENIVIAPKAQSKIEWTKLAGITTKKALLSNLESIKTTMIMVATGKQKIQNIEKEFNVVNAKVGKALELIGFENPNPFQSLWAWYEKWKAEFQTYNERRLYVNELFAPLLKALDEGDEPDLLPISVDLTGWEKVKNSLEEIKVRRDQAKTELQYQAVGMLCRETIISLAQEVYDPEKHPITDVKVSKTDSKRMLDAYIGVELAGSTNEILRRYAKATVQLADQLTHKRTATKKDMMLCATATLSLINVIGTLEERF